MNYRQVLLPFAITTLVCLPPGSAQDSTSDKKGSLEAEEQALGRILASEIERDKGLVDDPVMLAFLHTIAADLAHASAMNRPLSIKILNRRELDAFALPGALFFINSETLLLAQNEAEWAGLLAHLIAHITAGHGRQAVQTLPGRQPIPLWFLGSWRGLCLRISPHPNEMWLVARSPSREREEEADWLGIRYAHEAGYDPSGLTDFFGRVSAAGDGQAYTASERVAQQIQRYLETNADYLLSTAEFNDAQTRLRAFPPTIPADPPILWSQDRATPN
jgi:predicted Zn-dependent protease